MGNPAFSFPFTLLCWYSILVSSNDKCRENVVSQTRHPPFSGLDRKARIRLKRTRRDSGESPELAAMEAESEASDWGDIDKTGRRDSVGGEQEWLVMNSITSLCDCKVISIDSVEVIHPLICQLSAGMRERWPADLQARQSLRLISAFSKAFLSALAAPLGLEGPAVVE